MRAYPEKEREKNGKNKKTDMLKVENRGEGRKSKGRDEWTPRYIKQKRGKRKRRTIKRNCLITGCSSVKGRRLDKSTNGTEASGRHKKGKRKTETIRI